MFTVVLSPERSAGLYREMSIVEAQNTSVASDTDQNQQDLSSTQNMEQATAQ